MHSLGRFESYYGPYDPTTATATATATGTSEVWVVWRWRSRQNGDYDFMSKNTDTLADTIVVLYVSKRFLKNAFQTKLWHYDLAIFGVGYEINSENPLSLWVM